MDLELLKTLCEVGSPSGSEGDITEAIIKEIKGYVDEYRVDALGNIIARKKADGKKMMLAAHMDQIGFMVTYIDDDGFLYFSTIGGHTPMNLYSQRVRFKNGTIGIIACERLEHGKKDFQMEHLYVDIGAKDKAEAEKSVKIGDVFVFYTSAQADDRRIIAPAIDDRVGCFILIETLKALKNPAFDTYFVFTVQEELGLRGAKTAAYSIDPDYAVSFDVTLSYDTPNALKLPMKLNEGAAIKIKDASVLCHPIIVEHLTKTAEKHGIKHQFEILEAGGTDSGAIHLTKGGVPSGVISVPTRYVHTESELCATDDVAACLDLTIKMLEEKIG